MKKKVLGVIILASFILWAVDFHNWGGWGHSVQWWLHLPGFFSLFGLVGCLVLIGVAKTIGGLWLKRDENYYDDVVSK